MKTIQGILILLFCHLNLSAAFLKDYEALKNSRNYSEPHYVGMVDSITGKGGGLFAWLNTDLRPEAWGIILKSNESGRQGSWIRQDLTRISPDWLGAVNLPKSRSGLPPTFRNLGYEETTIRQRYFSYIPDISLDDTPDWAALQLACKLQEAGWDAITLTSVSYFINRTVNLPETKKNNENRHFIIEGNGAEIHQIDQTAINFFYTMPLNQKMSQDIFTARRFTLRNFGIYGKAPAGTGSKGIAIGGTFHSLIEDVIVTALDTGIVLRHAMSCVIKRCNAVNNFSVNYFFGSGSGVWTGATAINSSSNQSQIISSRSVAYTSQRACVVIMHSSECRVDDFTLDGGEKKHVDYVVYINTGLATTVKDGYVKGIHGEAMVDSALVKFRGNGNALFEVADLFIQYPCTLVELEVPSGYAQVNCRHFIYYPDRSNFANKGNGGIWKFDDALRGKTADWKTTEGYSIPQKSRILTGTKP
jgi:hypothetical protein